MGHSIPGHPMGLTQPSPILTKLCRNDAFGWPSLYPKFYPNTFRGCWNMTFWTFDLFDIFCVPIKFHISATMGRSEWSWCCWKANHPNNSFLVLFPCFREVGGGWPFYPYFDLDLDQELAWPLPDLWPKWKLKALATTCQKTERVKFLVLEISAFQWPLVTYSVIFPEGASILLVSVECSDFTTRQWSIITQNGIIINCVIYVWY